MGRKAVAILLLIAFLTSNAVTPLRYAYGQELPLLSQTGTRVGLSPAFAPPLLKGIKIYPDNPFRFDFILDVGAISPSGTLQELPRGEVREPPPYGARGLQSESKRLIKYFLASLTVPEKDLWVNLSPYEKDRIVPDAFGVTEMGRDLLAQDYLLKQITASVIYPEGETGKKFWAEVYRQAKEKFGTTDIPVDTFNKVWIVPEKAVVYESKDSAYVVESHLKVMLETDYLATSNGGHDSVGEVLEPPLRSRLHVVGAVHEPPRGEIHESPLRDVMRSIIIPLLEKEVNEGRNFAQLCQVYHSLILATWFKKKIIGEVLEPPLRIGAGNVGAIHESPGESIHESPLRHYYVDQNKTGGVDIADKAAKDKIWAQYVIAFKKGAYNYIKEEVDPVTQETMPRKYFSGGFSGGNISKVVQSTHDRAQLPEGVPDRVMIVRANMDPTIVNSDSAMNKEDRLRGRIKGGAGIDVGLIGGISTSQMEFLDSSESMVFKHGDTVFHYYLVFSLLDIMRYQTITRVVGHEVETRLGPVKMAIRETDFDRLYQYMDSVPGKPFDRAMAPDPEEYTPEERAKEAEAFVDTFVKEVIPEREEWEAWQFYQAAAKALSRVGVFYSYEDSREGDDDFEAPKGVAESEKPVQAHFHLSDFLQALYKVNPAYAAVLFAGFDDFFFNERGRYGEYYAIAGFFLPVDPEITAGILRINDQLQREGEAIELTPEFRKRWSPQGWRDETPDAKDLVEDHRRVYVQDGGRRVPFLIDKNAMPLIAHVALMDNQNARDEGKEVDWIVRVLSGLSQEAASELLNQYFSLLFKHSTIVNESGENENRSFGSAIMGKGGEAEESMQRELNILLEAAARLAREGRIDAEKAPFVKDFMAMAVPHPPGYWHSQWEAPIGDRLQKVKLFVLRMKQEQHKLEQNEKYAKLPEDKRKAALLLDVEHAHAAYYGFQALYGHAMASCSDHFLDLIFVSPEMAGLVIRGAPKVGHANVIQMFEAIMNQRIEGRTRLARFLFDIIPDWSPLTDEEFLQFYEKSVNPYDTTYLLTYFGRKIPQLGTLMAKEDFVKVLLCARRLMMVTSEGLVGYTMAELAEARPELAEGISEADRAWLARFGRSQEVVPSAVIQELSFEGSIKSVRDAIRVLREAFSEERHILLIGEDKQKFYSFKVDGAVEGIGKSVLDGNVSGALLQWGGLSETLLADMLKYEERIRGKEAFVLEAAIKKCRRAVAILDTAFAKLVGEARELKLGTSARTGISVGVINVVEHTDDTHELVRRISQVGRDQIAVARRFPTEYEQPHPNRGIVSGTSDVEGSPDHSVVLAARWLLPHAILPRVDVFLKAWQGQKVLFAAGADGVILRKVTDEEYARYEGKIATLMKAVKVEIPEADVNDPRRVTSLDEITGKDRNVFGAKAARLGEMKHKGMNNIPDGLGVPFSFYKAILDHDPALRQMIEDFLTTGREMIGERAVRLEHIKARIEAPEALPHELRKELADAIRKKFGDKPVLFVRSTSNCEDLKNFSGAGLHDSYEFIYGIDNIILHIQKVWASLWNLRAFEERERWNIDHRKAAMAVFLQDGRESSKSFVAFTYAPLTGKDDGKIYIWAAYGLGRTLVDKKQYPGEGALWEYDRKAGTVKNVKWTTKDEYAVLEKVDFHGDLDVNVRRRTSSFKGPDDYKVLTEPEALAVARQALDIEGLLARGRILRGDSWAMIFLVSSPVTFRPGWTRASGWTACFSHRITRWQQMPPWTKGS